MLCLAVTNLAKEFDLHSRFGSVVNILVVVVVERLAVSLFECWDYTPLLKFYLIIFFALRMNWF